MEYKARIRLHNIFVLHDATKVPELLIDHLSCGYVLSERRVEKLLTVATKGM